MQVRVAGFAGIGSPACCSRLGVPRGRIGARSDTPPRQAAVDSATPMLRACCSKAIRDSTPGRTLSNWPSCSTPGGSSRPVSPSSWRSLWRRTKVTAGEFNCHFSRTPGDLRQIRGAAPKFAPGPHGSASPRRGSTRSRPVDRSGALPPFRRARREILSYRTTTPHPAGRGVLSGRAISTGETARQPTREDWAVDGPTAGLGGTGERRGAR
jgi:hypothetical protein